MYYKFNPGPSPECNALSDFQPMADSKIFEMGHALLVPGVLVGTLDHPVSGGLDRPKYYALLIHAFCF
jgi:hypothetical protein